MDAIRRRRPVEELVVETADGIVTITIDRPTVLNALNRSGKRSLGRTLIEQIAKPETRAIVITGRGRAFCAGTDIKEMENFTSEDAEEIFRLEYTLQEAIRNAPLPVVAAVNGYALGTGCVLAMARDWSVASANASLGLRKLRSACRPRSNARWSTRWLVWRLPDAWCSLASTCPLTKRSSWD